MAALAVSIQHAAKRYGAGGRATAALVDVSLGVPAGQFLAVVGPSGSGKSTLLNLIAALDVPTAGRVLLDGDDVARLSETARSDLRLRAIGFVFQSFNLLPTFSALENVAWPLEFAGTGRRAARERAASALARLDVPGPAWARRPAELAGGEQQRVALARALVIEPRLLVADEPTGNLDSRTGEQVMRLLREANAAGGPTIIVVTHSGTAAACADRTVELRDGRLVRDTTK